MGNISWGLWKDFRVVCLKNMKFFFGRVIFLTQIATRPVNMGIVYPVFENKMLNYYNTIDFSIQLLLQVAQFN